MKEKKTGDLIREIREKKKYTQLYMAQMLDVTQQAYSNMEKNPDSVTLKRLKQIAGLLDVEVITLLGFDSSMVQQNFGQQGGNAASQMVNNYTEQSQNELYERLIAQLKEEILFLRTRIKD